MPRVITSSSPPPLSGGLGSVGVASSSSATSWIAASDPSANVDSELSCSVVVEGGWEEMEAAGRVNTESRVNPGRPVSLAPLAREEMPLLARSLEDTLAPEPPRLMATPVTESKCKEL